MYQYPEEWKQYQNAREFQTLVNRLLREIFDDDMVKTEWDASTHDLHRGQHKTFYFPRIDIAVGPFNSGMDRDVGFDNTTVMKSHPLFKKVNARNTIGWNKFSRCFLAVEIVFSGSSKHIMGDLANASWNGSIGFIVARDGLSYRRASKMVHYFDSSTDADQAPLHNLRIFHEDDFLQFLWELINPDKEKKLVTDPEYKISFGGFWPKSFVIKPHVVSSTSEEESGSHLETLCSILDIPASKMLCFQELQLSARKYLVPTTSAFIYELETKTGEVIKVMEIQDMAAQPKYRNRGIEQKVIRIFRSIAAMNNCKFVITDLPQDSRYEPLDRQKAYYAENGFDLFRDGRSQFSGWLAKAAFEIVMPRPQ